MTSETPSRAYNSLFEVAGAAAAADMAAEAAAFEAAAAAFEAARVAVAAAALAFEAAEAVALALAAAAAAGVVAAAVWAGDGAAAVACHGEAAPSARRKRLAIALTEGGPMSGFDRVARDLVFSASRVMRASRALRATDPGEPIKKRWRSCLTTERLAENSPCTGVRRSGKVHILTS
jgi:hypothetical protein